MTPRKTPLGPGLIEFRLADSQDEDAEEEDFEENDDDDSDEEPGLKDGEI